MSNKITLEDNNIYKKLLTQSDLSFSELCVILKKSSVKETKKSIENIVCFIIIT